MSSGIIPEVVWLGLFGGAALVIGFTFFFGTENLRAQSAMTGALSILIFSGLLIIIAIDYPLAGTVKVRPDALSRVIEDFGTHLRSECLPVTRTGVIAWRSMRARLGPSCGWLMRPMR